MAYPPTRSKNAELQKGLREASNQDDTPNRGGFTSMPTAPQFRNARRHER